MAATTAGRRLIVGFGVLIAVLLIAAGALSLVGVLALRSDRPTQQFGAVTSLNASLGGGSLTVRGTDDATATVSWRRQWDWSRPRLTASVVDGVLRLRARCNAVMGNCSVSATVRVPRGVAVVAQSSGGSVRVSGLTGALRLDSSAGSVTGLDLRSAQVDANSSAGSVHLVLAAAPTRVAVRSSAGSVDVAVPRDATSYRVVADASAGSRRVDIRTDPSSEHSITAHSSAGSVHVHYAN